jgi:hypothetical protein
MMTKKNGNGGVTAKKTVAKETQTEKTSSAKMSSSTVNKEVKTSQKEITAISETTLKVAPVKLSDRNVFVLFNTDGSILSFAQIDDNYLTDNNLPFQQFGEPNKVPLSVPGTLVKSDIAEIHEMCFVNDPTGKPSLELNKK